MDHTVKTRDRLVASCKRIHEGPGFRIPASTFRIPASSFWIPNLWILDSGFHTKAADSGFQTIVDSGFQSLDSGFQQQKFAGFRILSHGARLGLTRLVQQLTRLLVELLTTEEYWTK